MSTQYVKKKRKRQILVGVFVRNKFIQKPAALTLLPKQGDRYISGLTKAKVT